MGKVDMERPLRVFEGFAGYGGATYGLKRAGIDFDVVGYSEFDKFASALYDANHKNKAGQEIKNWGDITTIDVDLFDENPLSIFKEEIDINPINMNNTQDLTDGN